MDDEVGRGPLGSSWGAGEAMPDTELVRWAAAGDRSAFEELYRRYSGPAWRVAMAVTGRADDAADAVAESFARLLASFEDGRLRDLENFRAYLLSTTRNASIDVVRRSARLDHGDDAPEEREEDSPSGPAEKLMAMVDRSLVAAAFRSLPERWRSVLWLTEVEGLPPAEAGPLLGVSANGAAQLAVRARAGLRERFLQAHLRGEVEEGCRFTVERLGAYVAGGLAARDLAKLDQHLTACPACAARRDELSDLGPTLRSAVVAAPAGLGAAAWAHWQRGGPTSVHGVRSAVGMSGPQRALFGASVGLLGVGIIAATIVGQAPFGSDRFGSASAAPFGEDPAVATSRPATLEAAAVAPLSLDLTGAGAPTVAAPGGAGTGAGSGAPTGSPSVQTPTGGTSGGLVPPPLTGVGATSTPTSTPTLQVTATLPSVSPSAPNTGSVNVGGSGSPITVGTSPSSGLSATVGGSATGGSTTTVSAGTGGVSTTSGGSTTSITTPTTVAAPVTGTVGTVTSGATGTLSGTATTLSGTTLSGTTGTALP